MSTINLFWASQLRGSTMQNFDYCISPLTVTYSQVSLNRLRPRQNGRHFADDIFKYIFINESVWIPIKISQKFVPRGPINNIQALVQIMAWRHPGDKPLSDAMVVSLPTHICVTRPQWVKFGKDSHSLSRIQFAAYFFKCHARFYFQ